MKGYVLSALMGLFLVGPVHAKQLCKGIFPKNKAWIGVGIVDQGITEAEFNQVLDKITAIYNPIAAAHGYQLQFNRLWDDGTVNSDTDTEGDTWVINSYGGLARYNGINMDTYAAVACHELGHHLGGFPLFSDGSDMSVEGEADYHVGTKCLRKYFASDDNTKIVAGMTIDPYVITKCTANWPGDTNAQAVCERSAAAGMILAQILMQLDGDPAVAYNTPDTDQVDQTFEDHPIAQCRLDTYFGSSLCGVSSDTEFSPTDYKTGACVTGDGVRPRCWFAPPN